MLPPESSMRFMIDPPFKRLGLGQSSYVPVGQIGLPLFFSTIFSSNQDHARLCPSGL